MKGRVLRSINNIYTVKAEDNKIYSCRIKGKKLEQAKGEYNPIVAGDTVEFDVVDSDTGMVTHREERKTEFARWNVKSQSNQTICANMDTVVCVCSVESPPFRPRFIDRVIACCRNVPVLICMNKSDILMTEDEFNRFALYGKLGFDIISVSSLTGENIDKLIEKIRGKTVALVGQSGVGKSSLVNALSGADQRVGDVSEKFNRGCHTTICSSVIEGKDFTVIDTPGFREISVPHDDVRLVAKAFPEFGGCKCAYGTCLHVNEPECEVIEKVKEGSIDADRYESYLRILQSMEERLPLWSRNGNKKYR